MEIIKAFALSLIFTYFSYAQNSQKSILNFQQSTKASVSVSTIFDDIEFIKFTLDFRPYNCAKCYCYMDAKRLVNRN